MTLAGGVALALAVGGALPASAEDIVEGDTPVVLSADQSTFGEIPQVVAVDVEGGLPEEIDLQLFGGPENPEITMWTTTALSFNSEDRVFVALLTAEQPSQDEGLEHLCAIRLYDEDGMPLGSPLPVLNPDGGEPGAWPSECTGLELLDVLASYGIDLEIGVGFVERATNPTHAIVYFNNGDQMRMDARTGDVLDVFDRPDGGFSGIESFAISAGPAELIDPEQSGVAAIIALFSDGQFIVQIEYEDGEIDGTFGRFPYTVDGAEFDSELNLWTVSSDPQSGDSFVLSFDYGDLVELDGGGQEPVASTLGDGAAAGQQGEGFAAAQDGDGPTSFVPAAISGGVLVSGADSFDAGGITIVRGSDDPASDDADPELANTGPNDELLLTLGIIAGAIVIAGIVFTAVGASRRRAGRD